MPLRILLAGALLFALVAGRTDAADQPNFVWLIGEDCSKHFFQLFDDHGAATPRIAALADHGVVFERAFSCSPVCSVARTTLMTSCFAPRIAAQYHRRSQLARLSDGLRLFPAYLRQVGYYTTNRQKKDYNVVESPDVWDESSRQASWRKRSEDQPFFHMQSFGVSHESSLHFSAEEMRGQETSADPRGVFVPPIHPATPTFRYTYARYHDRIASLDRQIGDVVDDLTQDGLLEETFIFVFGDHGGVLPGSKGYAYETGLHVPLVVRIPDRWSHLVDANLGSRSRGFVSFVDFGPTLLHLAGVEPPAAVDGRPFLGPGVASEEVESRNEALGYADRFDEKIDFVRTLRRGRFKYVRSYQPFNYDALQNNYRYRMLAYQQWRELFQAGDLTPVQQAFFEPRAPEALYDLDADPYETRNLAGDPSFQTTLAELRSLLTGRVKAMPDLSFFPENVIVEGALADPAAFGAARREQLGRLIDVADHQLIPWSEARDRVAASLDSSDPWERYWGLIVCTTHGAEAAELLPAARSIAEGDLEPLVRVRAAEFLALTGGDDPADTVVDALSDATTGPEANLILNSLVMLRDGSPGFEFPDVADRIPPQVLEYDGVARRLEYLAP